MIIQGTAEAIALLERRYTELGELVNACDWVITHVAYKAPEQIDPEIRDAILNRLYPLVQRIKEEGEQP